MSRPLRLALIGMVSLAGLLALGTAILYAITQSRLDKPYSIQPLPVEIPSDPDSIANGEQIAQFSCAGCHGEDMSGQIMIDTPLDGRAAPSNLTSGEGGIGATYGDEDWVRAVWHGVDPDGRPLIGMPSDQFSGFDHHSLGSLIAYLKRLPPVDNVLPPTTIGLPSRVNFLLGSDPLLAAELIDHAALAGQLDVMPTPNP